MATKFDIREAVTSKILEALRAGTAPWARPWKDGEGAGGGWPRNGVSGRLYSGVNVFLLEVARMARGYTSSEWYTFKQAKQRGGSVRKGERATMVVFWKLLKKEDEETGEEKTIPLLRYYNVFNRDQIDGLPEVAPEEPRPEVERHEAAEAVIAATGARVSYGGNQACYLPATDWIHMPTVHQFDDAGAYYATHLHELVHWTGHRSRLARDLSGGFGSPDYAREELVAELGAAFLCAELGIAGRLQHAEYISHWIRILESDNNAIFAAASQAKRAADFINPSPVASGEGSEEEAA